MHKTDRYKEGKYFHSLLNEESSYLRHSEMPFKSCRLQKFTEDSLKITYRQLTPDTTDYRPLLKVFSSLMR